MQEGGGKRVKLNDLHTSNVVKMLHFYLMLGLTGRELQYKCLKPELQVFQTSTKMALELDFLVQSSVCTFQP